MDIDFETIGRMFGACLVLFVIYLLIEEQIRGRCFLNKGDRYYTVMLDGKMIIITRNKKIADEYVEINKQLLTKK